MLLSASAYTRSMRVMTVRLDEVSTVNGNDLCGLVPNEKLFRPAPKPRPYWNGPTEVRTGFVIF